MCFDKIGRETFVQDGFVYCVDTCYTGYDMETAVGRFSMDADEMVRYLWDEEGILTTVDELSDEDMMKIADSMIYQWHWEVIKHHRTYDAAFNYFERLAENHKKVVKLLS